LEYKVAQALLPAASPLLGTLLVRHDCLRHVG
jgi:hypothetical protein